MARIALKVDVDTLRGTLQGVPRLVDMFARRGIAATFLFSLGPDHTGWALRRVLRPGFLSKVSRTSVVRHYGVRTLMYGVLLPAPDIGRKGAAAMQACRGAGHECGIHTWDHVVWQDNVRGRDAPWTRAQMARAYERFGEVFGEPPATHGAAGWQMNDEALRQIDAWGMAYASDGRGAAPYRPVVGAQPLRHVQLPTTLLSQVDSSVGGKTGINHPLGKNMIGAFHQPLAVLADIGCLDTLPPRELAAGLAEVIKYGAIRDVGFLQWLESNIEALVRRDPGALARAVHASCRIKAQIVGVDEREQGERAILNFGHTFGHAIEAGLGYGAWLHGEAVGAGMILAAEVSRSIGAIDAGAVARLTALVAGAGLPTQAPALGFERWMTLMGRDKKVAGGTIRYILLDALGAARVRADVPEAVLRDLLR